MSERYCNNAPLRSAGVFWFRRLDYHGVRPAFIHKAWSSEVRWPWRQGPGVVFMLRRSRGYVFGVWWPRFRFRVPDALAVQRAVLADLEPHEPEYLEDYDLGAFDAVDQEEVRTHP